MKSKNEIELTILQSIETSSDKRMIIMNFNNGLMSVNGVTMPQAQYKAQYSHVNTSNFLKVSLNLGKEI